MICRARSSYVSVSPHAVGTCAASLTSLGSAFGCGFVLFTSVLLHFRFTVLSFSDSCKISEFFKLCNPAPHLQLLAQPAKLSSCQYVHLKHNTCTQLSSLDSELAFMYHGTSAMSSNSDSALFVDLSSELKVFRILLHALGCKLLRACCWSLGISAAWHALLGQRLLWNAPRHASPCRFTSNSAFSNLDAGLWLECDSKCGKGLKPS